MGVGLPEIAGKQSAGWISIESLSTSPYSIVRRPGAALEA
jgi:hypothetical protein